MTNKEALQKLKALHYRLNHPPLVYRRPDELDLPEAQRSWYMTGFSYEQMTSNLSNCVQLVNELIALLEKENDEA